MTFEEWEETTLRDVLKVSLEPSPDKSVTVLTGLREELQDEGATVGLRSELLDRLVWTRLTNHRSGPSSFDYLFKSWERANAKRRLVLKSDPDHDAKIDLLDAVSMFCVDFGVVAATSDPDDESGLYANVSERLVALATKDPGVWAYFEALCMQAMSQDTLAAFVEPIGAHISNTLATIGIAGEYSPYFAVLQHLVSIKPVAAQVTQISNFDISDGIGPAEVATKTFLGPFFALSRLTPEAARSMFPSPEMVPDMRLAPQHGTLMAELKVIQEWLFTVCDKIVRAGKEPRARLLKYFGKLIDMNHKRTATHVEATEVSPDGLMLNATYVLARLSEPFADFRDVRSIDKIEREYHRASPLYDITEETKLSADSDASKAYFSEKLETDVNFVSHLFYLTSAYMQYGLCGTIQSYTRMNDLVKELRANIQRLQAHQDTDPARSAYIRAMIDRMKGGLDRTLSLRLALRSIVHDPELMGRFLDFAVYQLVFAMQVAQPRPQDGLKCPVSLPFKDPAPAYFKNLPEYQLEAPVTFILHLMRFVPESIITKRLPQLPEFVTVFLTHSDFIKNPYLKSKFVEMLFFGAIAAKQGQTTFVDIYITDKLLLDNMFHALMKFYIEVESTGASSQFYDKFNIRYYISEVFSTIWVNQTYRSKLEKESKEDTEFFVRFVALLLNDVTYLFDESLSKLVEIHKLQRELDGVPQSDESEEIAEKRASLAAAERHASSYMQLTNQTVLLLQLFTSAVPQAFVTPEIVDRFAAMLNYNLENLVGPKCGELKVRDPLKYQFRPRELLSWLCGVYLNLSGHEPFVRAIARDGRSFKPSNFDRAVEILGRWSLLPPEKLHQLTQFRQAAEKVKAEDDEDEAELGEVPDEFLDPVMFSLMEEPVILPTSKVTIDLSTIKSHLLSDPKDPFNRTPLTLDQVIPNTELKEKIAAWKASQREKRQSGAN